MRTILIATAMSLVAGSAYAQGSTPTDNTKQGMTKSSTMPNDGMKKHSKSDKMKSGMSKDSDKGMSK